MTIKKTIYQNKNYDIKTIEKKIQPTIPSLLNCAFFDNMVVMPKCKCFININKIDIHSVKHAIETTGYIALIRENYRNKHIKRGCVGRILNFIIDDEEEEFKIHIEGLKRFLSYQDANIAGLSYEMVKPDFRLFENDDSNIPTPIYLHNLPPIFSHFFLSFINDLNIETNVDFANLSLDKFLNSMIMIMPISDAERFYLSEIPSLKQREEALSLILNCGLNNLTSDSKYH